MLFSYFVLLSITIVLVPSLNDESLPHTLKATC